MGFTANPKQRNGFFGMVAKAWGVQADLLGLAPSDKETWRRDELQHATGKRSALDCNATTDFEDAMAHFEVLAMDGIHWQMRRLDGNERRLRHLLAKAEHEHSTAYLQGILQQMRQSPTPPDLASLSSTEVRAILIALIKDAARKSV